MKDIDDERRNKQDLSQKRKKASIRFSLTLIFTETFTFFDINTESLSSLTYFLTQ